MAASKANVIPFPTPDPAAQRRKLVDEYAALQSTLAPHRAAIAREKVLEAEFRAWAEGMDPKASPRFGGNSHEVFLSPAGNQTQIVSTAEVFKQMGKARFLALCSITLKAVEAALGTELYRQLTRITQTGPRRITGVALRAQKAA